MDPRAPYPLSAPIQYEGATFSHAAIVRTPKVVDRIHAAAWVRDTYPGDDSDAILAATLAQVAHFGTGLDAADALVGGRRLAADIVVSELDYTDFVGLVRRMSPGAARDFIGSTNPPSGPPSTPSAGPGTDPAPAS